MKKTDTPANRGGYGPAYTGVMKRNYRRWAAEGDPPESCNESGLACRVTLAAWHR
jgi:hypothetical protein